MEYNIHVNKNKQKISTSLFVETIRQRIGYTNKRSTTESIKKTPL